MQTNVSRSPWSGFDGPLLNSLMRLTLAAWALGSFAFSVSHPAWSARAVLANALTNVEQRTLTVTLVMAFLAIAAVATLSVLGARSRAESKATALEAVSRAATLIAPMGLYGLYHAVIAEHVVLIAVSAIGCGAAAAMYTSADVLSQLRTAPSLSRLLRFTERLLPLLVVACALAHVYFLTVVIRAHFEGFANGWDLAIYDQVHWNIVDSGIPWSTLYSASESENHYSIHFSPIYHLTALVYALRKTPDTLTTLQNVALATGALPTFLLARHKTKSGWVGVCLALSYLLNPCIHSIAVYEFHEIAFFVPLVLWLTWALETERMRAFWSLAVLVLLIREDTPMYLAFFAVYLYLVNKRALALRLGVVAVGYLVLTHAVFMPALRHGRLFPFYDRFLDLQRGGQKGAVAILSSLFTNPLFCINYVIRSSDKLSFLALVLLPLAFAPLRAGRFLILCVPGFFFSLMSSFAPQYSIWGHYTAPFIGFLYCAATFGIAGFTPRARVCVASAALICSALLSGKYGRYSWLNPTFVEHEVTGSRARYGSSGERLLALAKRVPTHESVRATNNLVPALSARRSIFILPGGAGADWAFVDYRRGGAHSPGTFESARALCTELLTSKEYGVEYLDDAVVVMHRGADPRKNEETLVAIEATDVN